jgi:hypothetical protein
LFASFHILTLACVVAATLAVFLAVPQKAHATKVVLLKPPNNLGLIGYWPLNEGVGNQAGDFSGNGNTGTLGNNAGTNPVWTSGKRGKALQFDGSTNYVNMGNITAMNGLTKITVSAWIKSSSAGVNTQGQGVEVLQKSACTGISGDGPFELYIGQGVNKAEFGVYAPGGTNSDQSTTNVDDGTWHLLTGEYDGSNVTIWVDGVQQGTPTSLVGATLTNTTHAFGFSGYCDGGVGNVYNGIIDDVRVYNRALSATEIAGLYNQGTAGGTQIGASSALLQNGTSLGPKGGLIGHWTFDGADTQSTIADDSGQGNVGYMQGAATSSEKIAGVLGQALNFDTSDSVHIPNGTPYDFTNGTFSVAAWIKPSSNIVSVQRIVDHNGGCGNGWTLEYDNGFVATQGLSIQLNSIDFPASNNNVITLGQWQHVGFTDNAGSITFYVNGVAAGSTSTTPLPLAASSDLVIGGRTCDTARNINAAIDDVHIYNRALIASEMKRLYNLGSTIINK